MGKTINLYKYIFLFFIFTLISATLTGNYYQFTVTKMSIFHEIFLGKSNRLKFPF